LGRNYFLSGRPDVPFDNLQADGEVVTIDNLLILKDRSVRNSVSWVRGFGTFCQCCLGLLLSSSAFAGNVSFLGIAKTASFSQTSASSVVPAVDAPFSFRAFVGLAPAGKLLLAILFPPNGNTAPLILPPGGRIFSLEKSFAGEGDLNEAYPPGVYDILTHTFAHAAELPSMTLPADTFPDPPRLKNYGAAQNIDSQADVTLSWNPFNGAGKDDLVQLQVMDSRGREIFATPGLGATNALSGDTTFIVIPAGTLPANERCLGKLFFGKFTSLDRISYPNAVVLVGFFSQTSFTLGTLTPIPPPLRIDAALASHGLFQLEFPSRPGKGYQLESSSDLAAWHSVLTTNATGSSISFLDVETPTLPLRFFRVQTSIAE
jgi:hypothetical protein